MTSAAALKNVRQVFLDMDDTIYQGSTLFPTTRPFLEFLDRRGIGYAFLSNNSSYSRSEYVSRLAKLGISSVEDDFYTSTEYAIDYLKRFHPEVKRIFLLGMAGIIPAFEQAGFTVADDAPDALIVAFDRELTYRRLCRAAYFLHAGIPAFATHPDVFCPTDEPTRLVDCGAITACLELAAGRKVDKVLGKPDPGMLIAGAARYHRKPEECLMAGDRLATDVAVAKNAGALACHISPPRNYENVPEQLRPDFTSRNLGELQALWDRV